MPTFLKENEWVREGRRSFAWETPCQGATLGIEALSPRTPPERMQAPRARGTAGFQVTDEENEVQRLSPQAVMMMTVVRHMSPREVKAVL